MSRPQKLERFQTICELVEDYTVSKPISGIVLFHIQKTPLERNVVSLVQNIPLFQLVFSVLLRAKYWNINTTLSDKRQVLFRNRFLSSEQGTSLHILRPDIETCKHVSLSLLCILSFICIGSSMTKSLSFAPQLFSILFVIKRDNFF